jgi:hypothetical protein
MANLIRESGDKHRTSWMDNSPLGWFHDFSIGIANIQGPAFAEVKDFSKGTIDYDLDATAEDPINRFARQRTCSPSGSGTGPGRT